MENIIFESPKTKIVKEGNTVIKYFKELKSFEKELEVLSALQGLEFVPTLLSEDESNKSICMEFIDGKSPTDYDLNGFFISKVAKQITQVADKGYVVSDLHLNNMILVGDKIFFIDFEDYYPIQNNKVEAPKCLFNYTINLHEDDYYDMLFEVEREFVQKGYNMF